MKNLQSSTSQLANEDLAKRLTILKAALSQRINSTVSLIKATARYVHEMNIINDQDIEALKSLDKQISILNGNKKESSIAGGEIKVPDNNPESGASN